MTAIEVDNLEPTVAGDIVSGRWKVAARLAEGGMGVLYLAQDEKNNKRRVVLKFPKKSLLYERGFRERFERETRSLLEFEHPHVVRVYDTGTHNDWPYVVLQYLPGGSLGDRIRQRPQTLAELSWLPQVAGALDAVHRQGIVHRDVKAANILFDIHGEAYLSDFGIIKIVASLGHEATLTQGALIGSPDSFAPECIDPFATPITPAYDQFGLAMAVYRALSGRQPFYSQSTMKLLLRLATEPPPSLEQVAPVPAAIAEVVAKAMSIDPEERFASCSEFARALDEARQSQPVLTLPNATDALTAAPIPQNELTAVRSHQPRQNLSIQLPADAEIAHEDTNSDATPPKRPRAKRLVGVGAGVTAVLAALVSLQPFTQQPTIPQAKQPIIATAKPVHPPPPQPLDTEQPVAGVAQPMSADPPTPPVEPPAVTPAKSLSPKEMSELGRDYLTGSNGKPRHDGEALKWFRRAAAQNDALGQVSLGYMYEKGRGGLPKDNAAAVKWYKLAAEQGNLVGQVYLADMYQTGRGIAKDDAAAAKWYKLAAEQGSAFAQVSLGIMYAYGVGGLPQDERGALEWFQRAADMGDAGGQMRVGMMYQNGGAGLMKDDATAAKWYTLAAEQGNALAQASLASMYMEGRGGLPQDAMAAAKWFKLAAEQGADSGQLGLGIMYLEGLGGLTKDDAAATKWIALAADQGNRRASSLMADLARQGNEYAKLWVSKRLDVR